MFHRMLKLGNKAHMHYNCDFVHAWLNFDSNGLKVPAFLEARMMILNGLADLLDDNEDVSLV